MATEEEVRGAFRIQEFYCRTMDAPIYAGVCAVLADGLSAATAVGARVLGWCRPRSWRGRRRR